MSRFASTVVEELAKKGYLIVRKEEYDNLKKATKLRDEIINLAKQMSAALAGLVDANENTLKKGGSYANSKLSRNG
jgi:nitrogenase subunit NifH